MVNIKDGHTRTPLIILKQINFKIVKTQKLLKLILLDILNYLSQPFKALEAW